MTDVRTRGNLAWRDWATDHVPSSGLHEVLKTDIRKFVDVVASAIGVPTLAAFRALEDSPESVRLLGGVTPGDGVEGLFRPDVNDDETADDGLLTIVTAAGVRYKRVFDGEILSEWKGAKGDGVTVDTVALVAAIAAGYYVSLRPGKTYPIAGISIGTAKTVNGRGALVKAAAGASRQFILSGYNPYLKEVYVADNAASSGPVVEINGERLASIQDLTVIGAGAGAILIRDVAGTGVALANINDIHAEQITGVGVDIRSSVSEIKGTNIHMSGQVDFVDGLGKPRAGSVGWRQNTPLVGSLARGGHQIVNANMIALETGYWLTDAELSELTNAVADGCSGYGVRIDGDSKDITFTHFYVGSSLGLYVGGASRKININGLETKFNGIVPPWGQPDFYDSAGPYYDVTVADTASLTINGNAWFGEKRVSVAPGASLTVTGGEWFRGRSGGTVAAGQTVYLAEYGATATESDATWRAPYAGYLFLLRSLISDVPGSGQNFIYTVRVNGIAVALTATIANTGVYAVRTYGPVLVAEGDEISIEVMTSAGSAARRHQASVQMLPL